MLLRQAESMGMVETFELAAIASNNFESGGVNNTEVLKFVYRWTEREFERAINTFDPAHRHRFRYFHSLELPHERMRQYKSLSKKLRYGAAATVAKAFRALFPRQILLRTYVRERYR